MDGVCFYVADGEGRVRVSNPPEAKRVKKAASFSVLRRYADYLKLASPLASAMHKKLPAGKQRHHYQRLAGVAIRGMKAGEDMDAVVQLLEQEAALICDEIAEGCVTAVVHGEQLWAIQWKDGEPALKKRRRKTTILKSSASVQQRQVFEELRGKGDSVKLGVGSLELGVGSWGVGSESGVDSWELGVEQTERVESEVSGVELCDEPVEYRELEEVAMEGKGSRSAWFKCEIPENDLFESYIEKPLARLPVRSVVRRVHDRSASAFEGSGGSIVRAGPRRAAARPGRRPVSQRERGVAALPRERIDAGDGASVEGCYRHSRSWDQRYVVAADTMGFPVRNRSLSGGFCRLRPG